MIRDERARIHLMERASRAVNCLLTAQQIPASHGLRLSRGEDGVLVLVVDAPRSGDAVLNCLWAPVLIADPYIVAATVARALDLVADADRETFPPFCMRPISTIEAGVEASRKPIRLALSDEGSSAGNRHNPDERSATPERRADTNRILASATAG